jgi:hypothetical protein
VQRPNTNGLRVVTGGDRRGKTAPAKRKLLYRARDAVCSRHCSRSTERCCPNWIKRFILFHVRMTMIHTRVPDCGGQGVRSPADAL